MDLRNWGAPTAFSDTVRPMNDSNTKPEAADESIAALRAENEALRSQLEGNTAQASGSGVRRVFAWVLAILAIVLISLAVNVGWAKTTLLHTDTFVATLSPLAQNEAVAEALSVRIGEAVVVATSLEESISEALPAELAFIAGPVATATGDLVATVANELILTDAFSTVWSTALRVAHSSVIVLVSGTGALGAEDGTVAIDLDAIAEPVVVAVADRGLDIVALVGEDFTLGQIVLIESEALGSAQSAVRFLEMLGWLTVLLAILAVAAAIVVSPDRRRQVAILGFGTAIAGVSNLVSLRLGRGLTVGSIGDEINRSAGLAVWDALIHSLKSSIWALVFLSLAIGLAAWLVGPGLRAGHMRTAVGDGLDRWRGKSQQPPTGVSLFFYTWRRPLEWAILGVGLAILLLIPTVSLLNVVLIILVGGFAAAAIEMTAGPQSLTGGATADNESENANVG